LFLGCIDEIGYLVRDFGYWVVSWRLFEGVGQEEVLVLIG